MAPDPPPGVGSQPGDDAADPIASLLESVADYWTHALSGVVGSVNGTYTASDVLGDLMKCSMRAGQMGVDLLRGVGLLAPAAAPHRNPIEVIVDVPVDPAQVSAATPLSCGGLRAIGFGAQYVIPAAMVQIGAPALGTNGETTVPVKVSFANVGRFERHRTIIYEGTITAPPLASGMPWSGVVRVPKPAQ